LLSREQKLIGGILRDARTKAGLTQVELSRRLRTPQSVLSSYERGQHRIAVLDLIRFAKALEIDARSLFTEIVAKIERR
jgi:uncharacterized protein